MNKIYIAIIIGTILLSGCYSDKSNMDLLPQPQIVIPSDPVMTTNTASAGEEMEMWRAVIWNDCDSTQFDYEWLLDGKVISNERTLHHIFSETGDQYLTFRVVERSTGISVSNVFKVTVNSKFLYGWLLLCDKDSKSTIHYIDVNNKMSPDIYNVLWPEEPLGSSPVKMVEHFAANIQDQILIIQKGGDGLVELDGFTFKKIVRTWEEFVGGNYPYSGFEPVNVMYATNAASGPEMLMTAKGEVYSRMNLNAKTFQNAQYPTIPLEYPDNRGMSITAFTGLRFTYFSLMFDNLNRRWLALYKYGQTDMFLPALTKGWDDSEIPEMPDICNGMDPKYELVYAETTKEFDGAAASDGIMVNILKDKTTGQYYFYRCVLAYNKTLKTITVNSPTMELISGGIANITDKTQYSFIRKRTVPTATQSILFFGTERKLYFYRWDTKKIYLFKDFDKCSNPPTGVITTVNNNYDNTRIGVGFSDGHFFILESADATLGKITRGDLDVTDPAVAATLELAHFTDLGNVVHSIWKYGTYTRSYVGNITGFPF